MNQRTNSNLTHLSINIEQQNIIDEDLSEEKDLIAYCLFQIITERGFSPKHAQFAIDQIPQKHFHSKQFAELLETAMKTLVSASNSEQSIPTRPREKSIIETIYEVVNTQSPNIATYLEYKHASSLSQKLIQFTCLICFESFEQNGIIYQLDCEHQFCNTCLTEYCKSLIMDGSSDLMICPSVGCFKLIKDECLLKIVGQELYCKMIKFRNIKKLALDPDIIWCPKPECENFVRQTKTKLAILQCNCGQKICTKCHRQAHAKKSCSKSMDILYKKAVKKLKIQKCKKCNSPIQKDEGCNHMTCKQCHYEFCWLCQQSMTDNHYKSFNIFGCPGMQFSQKDPYSHPAFTRFLYISSLILLSPLLILIGIIGLIIGLPALIYMNRTPSTRFAQYSCCEKYCIIQLIIFACIIFMPLSLIVVCFMIIVCILGFPYFLYLFIRWICE